MNSPAQFHQPVRFSIVTSTYPRQLAKRYQLADGKLSKTTHAHLSSGSVTQQCVETPEAFAAAMSGLQPNQALIFGITEHPTATLTTAKNLRVNPDSGAVISRQKRYFDWPSGPAILCVDYDPPPGLEPLSRDALLHALERISPYLTQCARVWVPSSSSHIMNRDTGEDLTGLKGQRVYFFVADGLDIERAGKVLVDRLFLHGYGVCIVSATGSRLERTIVDASVFQPNHLDFAAGPVCDSPLERRKINAVCIPGPLLDTRQALPELSEKEKNARQRIRQKLRKKKEKSADRKRAAYIERKKAEIQEHARVKGLAHEDTPALSVTFALEKQFLNQEFVIHFPRGATARVEDILRNPERYDGESTLDPLEPEYDNHKPVGKLFLRGPKPCLHSFAHGSTTYRLGYSAVRIEIPQGDTYQATEETIRLLRRVPTIFDYGDQLVLVNEDHIEVQSKDDLQHHLGGMIHYWEWKPDKNDELKPRRVDPPARIVNALLALGDRQRRLKPLKGLITAPLVSSDGRILATPGYDEETALMAHFPEQDLPQRGNPSYDELRAAVRTLLHPFEAFPFVSRLDKSILLAGILTAFQRPILPTAPGFAFDAPTQGSGKTLIAQCLAALATGRKVSVMPQTETRFGDDELRKRLLALLMSGDGAVIFDNLVDTFDSASLAAALTSETYRDRVLRKSALAEVPNRALFLFTGNNLSLKGDLIRRILVCRIDPACERPYAREFSLDPLEYALYNRREMANASCTLICAWLEYWRSTQQRIGVGRTASYELWDLLVRQTVAWIGRDVMPDTFEDPLNAIANLAEADPERDLLEQLCRLIYAHFGDNKFTSSDIKRYSEQAGDEPSVLKEHISDLTEKQTPSTNQIGRALAKHVDRHFGRYTIRKCGRTGGNTTSFKVESLKH